MRGLAYGLGLLAGGVLVLGTHFAARGGEIPLAFALTTIFLLSRRWVFVGYGPLLAAGIMVFWLRGQDPASLYYMVRRLAVPPLLYGALVPFALFALPGLLAAPKEAKRALPLLGLLLLETWLVAYLSGGAGGPGWMHTQFLHLGLTPDQAETAVIAVRKTIHISFYGSVGLTALAAALRGGDSVQRAMRLAIAYPLALACFDEMRQTTASNRSGQWTDVVIDMIGVGLALAFIGRRWGSRPERSPNPT